MEGGGTEGGNLKRGTGGDLKNASKREKGDSPC